MVIMSKASIPTNIINFYYCLRLGFYCVFQLQANHLIEHEDEQLRGSRKQLNVEKKIMIIS